MFRILPLADRVTNRILRNLLLFNIDERSEERRVLPINPHSKLDVLVRVTTVKWCDRFARAKSNPYISSFP